MTGTPIPSALVIIEVSFDVGAPKEEGDHFMEGGKEEIEPVGLLVDEITLNC